MNICPICGGGRRPAFSAVVLDSRPAEFVKCDGCGLLAAEDPIWLDEAYESPIADIDTGVLRRARDLEPRLICLLRLALDHNGTFLDTGAGYGLLVRMMRDIGMDFRWDDPHCENLLAKGFEHDGSRVDAVIATEVLEHVRDPLTFLRDLFHRTGADLAVFTTELLPSAVPDPLEWWYYAFPTGQHISFFERRTLVTIAKRLDLRLRSRRNFHVLHRGNVRWWHFALASTRLARPGAAVLRRGLVPKSDSPLLH